ncbi:MAG: M3 family oligoendopeptidase [Sphaerochaetaceae bacterium]|jgi:pepF/M3 family oligoendopeptidase|nr:M3 family oligoendopeptidase [Sphaerochaetaceae bacterium]NLO60713.1 M3 family oligoendopeptidase [Spirochaetales bacterium]MDD2406638.1 M3 family oligoendopeptidase [Sphaerochaetaceae bacterium]MDD3669657.1 M3 family oligoendopeptidase [Sphaerochaetaceae bacterium]MDD4258374.1 M3 family oligoendopeptidase [Sphaerochaetaceae bacterium]
MEQIPRWNLDSIYSSLEGEDFEADMKALKTLTEQLKTHISGCQDLRDFNAWFKTTLDLMQTTWDTIDTLGAYAHALLTVDTSDEKAMHGLNKVDEIALDVKAVYVKVLNAFATHKESVRNLINNDESLKRYAFVIEELLEEQRHQMSEAEEALAADLNRSGTDSWSRLQQAVSSSSETIWDEETQERKTVIQLRSMAFDPDRNVREKAFNKELSIWKLHETAFAYALNGVKGTTITLDKKRGYKDPLERSVKQARITDTVLEALIGSIESYLPMFRRYLKAKAKLMGLPKLAFFDLFAPVGLTHQKYSFDAAKEFIIENFSAFHLPLGEFAKMAFEKQWIDAESRVGKVGGAYCTSMPLRKETRVLCNFDHSFDSVSTIAHELGHAYHDKVTSELPALLRNYPMTLAETASIFSQFIIFQGALKHANTDERLSLIEGFLQDSTQVCVDILSRFYFEKDVFEKRVHGDIMADELSRMMVDAQKRSYGDALEETQLHPYMWAVKSHYYSSGLSYYNYPYAFGQLFGLGVYQLSQDYDDFGARYDQLLHTTGMYSAPEVTAKIGCDITTEEFWKKSLDLINTYVDEFCQLCDYKE